MHREVGEQQLEFFEGGVQHAPRPQRAPKGHLLLHLRYEQLVVATMVGVIGITVVFAGGVERGKQLVRSERVLLPSRALHTSGAPGTPVLGQVAEGPSTQTKASRPAVTVEQRTLPEDPPSQVASGGGGRVVAKRTMPTGRQAVKATPSQRQAMVSDRRYAIQVSTYSRAQLASQELARLQARGEPAFLIRRERHTAVYVGPFPSEGNARKQVTRLKARYQDCFVKTL